MSERAAEPSPYDAFVEAFHDHRCLDANRCVELGVERRRGELPDPSLEAIDDRNRAAAARLQELEALQSDDMAFDERLDLDLARLLLEAERFDLSYEFNDATTARQQPRAGDEIGDGIFLLSVSDPRPATERLADVTSRVEAIPAYLDQLLARLERPVKRWVDMDRDKVKELPTLLASLLDWAQQERFADAPRLERAVATAQQATTSYVAALSSSSTTTQLHVGPQTASRLIQLRGIELGMDELHRLARDFLAETSRQIEELRAKLVSRYTLDPSTSAAELQAFLNRRFRVQTPGANFEPILERYRQEHRRLVEFIAAHDLFSIPDGQALRILSTPDFMRPSIPAGAMTPPAPFRPGTRESLIFLTLSEELLDEHTELGIPVMMVHEGIPGHHLQLASASMHPSRIRRHVMANDQAEGWTTMLEDYMLDRGYLVDAVDEARFCAKRDLSRIGARVAIDLFLMTGERDYLSVGVDNDPSLEDPFDAAGDLLRRVTGFTPNRVQAELNWYSQERGYPLSYLTGNSLVQRLRSDVQAARPEGSRAELDRLFFDEYLAAGNMPLGHLRRVFEHRGLVTPAPAR